MKNERTTVADGTASRIVLDGLKISRAKDSLLMGIGPQQGGAL
jgi:hypothetical protein